MESAETLTTIHQVYKYNHREIHQPSIDYWLHIIRAVAAVSLLVVPHEYGTSYCAAYRSFIAVVRCFPPSHFGSANDQCLEGMHYCWNGGSRCHRWVAWTSRLLPPAEPRWRSSYDPPLPGSSWCLTPKFALSIDLSVFVAWTYS